jgi:hypothetical protein
LKKDKTNCLEDRLKTALKTGVEDGLKIMRVEGVNLLMFKALNYSHHQEHLQ